MNYLVEVEESMSYPDNEFFKEKERLIFSDTDLSEPRHSTDPVIQSIDDVIQVMEKRYPEVKDYKIRETPLSIIDIEANDKIRAEQECKP